MRTHDCSHLTSGIFDDFHSVWIANIRSALNEGILPSGYYALAEQHANLAVADILTLRSDMPESSHLKPASVGGTMVADAPPRTRRRMTVARSASTRPKSVAIRHVSGHELIALIEVVPPGNKDRSENVRKLAEKGANALNRGVHVLMLDLLPPGAHDLSGIHMEVVKLLTGDVSGISEVDVSEVEPITLTAFAAGDPVEVYLEQLEVGPALPDMPLFLQADRYVDVPLQPTYDLTYKGFPKFWQEVLETGESDRFGK